LSNQGGPRGSRRDENHWRLITGRETEVSGRDKGV
jgi:hypothetical protein